MEINRLEVGQVISTPRGLGSFAGLQRVMTALGRQTFIITRLNEIDPVTGQAMMASFPMEQVWLVILEPVEEVINGQSAERNYRGDGTRPGARSGAGAGKAGRE